MRHQCDIFPKQCCIPECTFSSIRLNIFGTLRGRSCRFQSCSKVISPFPHIGNYQRFYTKSTLQCVSVTQSPIINSTSEFEWSVITSHVIHPWGVQIGSTCLQASHVFKVINLYPQSANITKPYQIDIAM